MTAAPVTALHGELPSFLRRTLGLRSVHRFRYDSMERVRIGEAAFLLTHPDDIRHVLVTNAANYTKTPLLVGPKGQRRAGAGLLTASGTRHLRQRRLLLPLFRRDAVALLDGTIHDAAVEMLDRWEATASRIDLGAELTALAKSIAITVLFGTGLDDEDAERLGRAIAARRRFTELVYHGRLPMRNSIPTPTVQRHRRALRLIDTMVYDAITQRRAGASEGDDLIAQLIAARYDDGSAMTDDEVRDEVLTVMSTGYETLAETLTWALYLLARHPDVEEELHAELAALGGRHPAADDLARLPFTEMLLAETLRLYPATWLYVRVPVGPDVLPRGGAVTAGATLYVCPYVLHRHPRYFPEPERFDPQRFAAGRRPPRYVYLPFGDGLHRCLGEHLARLEATLVLALVSQRVRIRLLGGSVEPYAGVTLRPGRTVWATAEPRPVGVASAR